MTKNERATITNYENREDSDKRLGQDYPPHLPTTKRTTHQRKLRKQIEILILTTTIIVKRRIATFELRNMATATADWTTNDGIASNFLP